jgi:iron(III) transport system permease protein
MTPTLKHFDYVQAHITSLKNSLVYSTVAAVVCAGLAIVLSYLTQRKRWTGRSVVDFLAIAPAAVPGIFFGIGYALTFNERWLDWIDRGALMTTSMIFWNIPIGYRGAVAGLSQIDRSIDEAATSMGAGSLRTLREILVPLLRAPLLTAFITTFVRAITTLSVVIFLFTPSTTVATITVFQLINDFNWGGAAAFTVSVITMAVLVVSGIWILAGRRVRLEEVGGG